jgi:hypothetical protein
MPNDFEEFADLERELRALSPRPVSPAVLGAIGRSLDGPAAPAVARAPFWVTAPVAAALVAAVAWLAAPKPSLAVADGRATSPNSSARVYKPIATEAVLYSFEVGSLVALPDGSPARTVRNRYMDTIVWRNAETNASLQWSLPRDEVRLVRVELY